MQKGRRRLRPAHIAALVAAPLLLVIALVAVRFVAQSRTSAAVPHYIAGLHVEGNRLVDGGKTVQLFGVNHSGTEYACIQGWGIFSGPNDDASIQAMADRSVRAVRVQLNEDCWLGINGVQPQYGGAAYQAAIADYVKRLRAHGLYVILDLQWAAAGGNQATDIPPMPDADHSITFWSQVAAAYKDQPSVLFDLANEPHDVTWTCWRDGGAACDGADYQMAGMQQLVNAIRAAGAKNVILAEGLGWGNDLSQWLMYKPNDPANNLVASWHVYKGTGCDSADCWDREIAPVAAITPVFIGEFCACDFNGGGFDQSFGDKLLAWADQHGASYAAWTWNQWNQPTDLIADDTGSALTDNGKWLTERYGARATASGQHLPAAASQPVTISGASCTVTVDGLQKTGTCTGVFSQK